MNRQHTLIIQFAKWPVPGRVKTRLAAEIGNEAACNAHVELMNSVFSNIKSFADGDFELWFDEYHCEALDSLGEAGVTLADSPSLHRIQCQGDLGEKMADAFERSVQTYDKVIIVGSDCPTVDSRCLSQAAALLQMHDVVLGPAEDGGYVLIGARSFESAFFADVPWGESDVLAKTLANIAKSGYSCGLLPTTWDVDSLSDYRRWTSG